MEEQHKRRATRRAEVRQARVDCLNGSSYFPIRTANAACAALRLMAVTGNHKMHADMRARICHAVALFIADRENEIKDIEYGTVSLLKQAAQMIGNGRR